MQRLKKIIVSFAAFLLVGIPAISSANDLALPSYSGEQSGTEQSPAAPSNDDPTFKPFLLQDADIWSRIRNGFGIPDLESNLVTTQTNWYSARPDYMQRATQRASRYLYHVVEELEKR